MRYFPVILGAFSCLFSLVNASEPAEKQIIVIGDSLSDSGNLPETTIANIPLLSTLIVATSSPKTDGTTWPVWLNDLLYRDWLLPSSQGGTNYAVAGAVTSGSVPIPPFPFNFPVQLIPSLTLQVDEITPKVDRDRPVFIFGGANDFIEIGFIGISPDQPTLSAENISKIVDNIHNLDFKTQIVINLPDLGDVPALSSGAFHINNPDINLVRAYGLEYNALLAQALAKKDFPVLGIDAEALLSDIVANPGSYGFTNVTDPTPTTQYDFNNILNPPTVGSPTDGYLFYYDGLHPTSKAHRTLAEFIFTTLAAPSFFGELSQKSFSVSREIAANMNLQSFAVQPCHCCEVLYPFLNGSYAPLLKSPENPRVEDHCNPSGDITYGATYDFNQCWRFGLAGSYARTGIKNKMHLTHAHARLATNAATIFGNYHNCDSYILGTFTASWHDFKKIRRSFSTGFASHEASGKTHGNGYYGELIGAYLCFQPVCNFATGPLFDLNYQWVSIDGYKEKRARIGNLQYKNYHNSIFSTGLGWEARFCFDAVCFCWPVCFTADASIMANRQWLEHTKDILFRQISFGENFGSWPVVIARKNNYISASLKLSADVCNCALFTCSYNCNIGNLSMSEHVITFGITMPLDFF